ncbi:MAG: RluA family pseudouridine synthase [Acidaminococcaceae bacterium]|jgi:23S rRNA pseudouridine1911/1915/1917 synthase|nr:RluA family pseudouridine synthase [Acidaminococcaceae bacterium]MCI2110044.1 RluA family pseudouridine synthase [Acidaminococcaceae bacterium]
MVCDERRKSQGKIISTEPVTQEETGTRVDVFLAKELSLTRAHVQKSLEEGLVLKGTKALKANYKVKTGDIFQITIPEPVLLEVTPENIPLNIIYEDEDVVVVNKARGMVVHPAAGNYTGTLVNALLYHCKNLSGINGIIRPGIVHRLDKDTSGVMIVAKNDKAHLDLSAQIQSKEAKRTYLAVVRGNIKDDKGRIITQIARDVKDRKKMAVVNKGGRQAITDYEVLERYGRYTVVRCHLLTGRTHQIRVHMEYIGHPLVGDPKYSPMKTCFAIDGQALHSETLEFRHPRTGKIMKFSAPLPEDMEKIVVRLRNGQFT